jgi:hypothetical protein
MTEVLRRGKIFSSSSKPGGKISFPRRSFTFTTVGLCFYVRQMTKLKKNHRNEQFTSLLFNENIFQRVTRDRKKKNRTFQEFNIILPRILKLITIVPKEDDEGFLVCAKDSVTSLIPPHYLTIIETETGPNENLSLLL